MSDEIWSDFDQAHFRPNVRCPHCAHDIHDLSPSHEQAENAVFTCPKCLYKFHVYVEYVYATVKIGEEEE